MAGPSAFEHDATTLDRLLLAAAASIGDHEAYVEVATGQRLTFAEWVASGRRLAAHLRDLGVQRGDVVAIALPPSIDFVIGVAGVALMGAVVTGINHRLGPREIEGIVDRCRPAAVLADDESSWPSVARVVPRSTLARLPDLPFEPDDAIAPDDPAVIIWTSGTTGIPKGAWFDHRRMAAAVRTAGEMTEAFDRRISGIPLAHAGYLAKVWELCEMGVTVVLTPTPWSAATMLEVLVDERITAGAAVPTQWAKLLEEPGIAAADLSALRICLAATAPAAPELVERIGDVFGAPVVVRYAMTESPSITGTSPGDPPEVQYRTVGRPQDGVALELVDADGLVVPPGVVGRVRVHGPVVMRGYWNDPERTAEVLDTDGWLTSGDLGRIDADGNLILVGRATDMYIRGGYNVYPLEVENVLAEHPSVSAVAVVGRPAPVIGEVGVAFVVPAPGATVTLSEVRGWVRDRLADYKAPDELRLLAALPLTTMGKVDKTALTTLTEESSP